MVTDPESRWLIPPRLPNGPSNLDLNLQGLAERLRPYWQNSSEEPCSAALLDYWMLTLGSSALVVCRPTRQVGFQRIPETGPEGSVKGA